MAGSGWDHTEANQDIEVSPVNPDFRAHIENEWSAVLSRDGQYFEPIHMPYIGGGNSKIEDLEFSGFRDSTLYIVLAHEYWSSLPNDISMAGIWRSRDLGVTWEHIYRLPEGTYERFGNYPEGTHLLEDPVAARSHHIYFGTTSHGIIRSTDGGASWENIAPALSDRCIKMIEAGRAGDETWIYAIAEKKMPVHMLGGTVPLNAWGPTDFTEQWDFDNNLEGEHGNGLAGSVASWSESSAGGSHAARLIGCVSELAIENLHYSGSYSGLSVTSWVKSTNGGDQVIASFDEDAYWELGINRTVTDTGRVTWTINNSSGKKYILVSSTRVDDGDWHHVAGVWDNGEIRIYVDGEEEAYKLSETSTYGSGVTRYGYLGAGSKSEVYGDGLTVDGACFDGYLDEMRIYNDRGLNLNQYRGVYLECGKKYQVPQGSLWRVKIGSSGSVTEVVRLHKGVDDFTYVEPNPYDPSTGWVIRKALPNSWPYGGRELYRFSEWGEKLHLTSVREDNSDGIYTIHISRADTSHIFLRCGGDPSSALRYSLDAGLSWQGTGRPVIDGTVPSLQPWSPSYYKNYLNGLPQEAGGQPRGTDITLVRGVPGEILYISATAGLFQSKDYGATFTGYGGGGSNKDLGQMAVAPGNPDYWATATFEFGFKNTNNGGIFWEGEGHSNNELLANLAKQSETAGSNWTFSRTGVGIAYHPFDSHQMIATYTKLGFILRSGDAGSTWTYTGTMTGEASNVFWCRADAQRIYVGNKRSTDGGRTWTDIQKHVIAVSDANADIVVGLEKIERDITAQTIGIYLSLDGGTNWVILPTPARELVPGTSSRWNVVATSRIYSLMPMDLIDIDPSPGHDPAEDPENRVRLLMAGRSGVYEYIAKNADGSGSGSDWKIMHSGIEPNRHYSNIEPVPWIGFVIFDPRPGSEHVVYAAKTNDWQTLDDWCGETNRNHSYPGGDNFEPFYMSLDGGLSWNKLHGDGYPGAPVSAMIHSLEVDSQGKFYAATCEGIYHIAVNGVAESPPDDQYRVQFTIMDEETGEPVPWCGLDFDSKHNVADEKGRAGIDGVVAGTYTVSAGADHYSDVTIPGIEIYSDTSLVIQLISNSHHVTVRVVDRASGETVPRARIGLDGQLKTTSIPGEVYYDKIEPGFRVLSIAHPDYFTWSDSILISADTTLVIEITAILANILFDVRDADGPVNALPVTLCSTTVLTGSTGIAVFRDQPACMEYSFIIEKAGYLPVRDTFFLETDTTLHILLEEFTGPGNYNQLESLTIFPNPALDILFIEIPVSGTVLNLLSSDGKLQMVHEIYPGLNEMNISGLQNGIYFLQLKRGHTQKLSKLIVQR